MSARVERLAAKVTDMDWGREQEELLKALDWAPKSLTAGRDKDQIEQIKTERKQAWRNWTQQPHCFHNLAQTTADTVYARLAESGDAEALKAWLVYGHYPSRECYTRLASQGFDVAAGLWRRLRA